MIQGQVAITAGTPVQLSTTGNITGIAVKALSTNTSGVTLGNSQVSGNIDGTGNGYVLLPGDQIILTQRDVSRVWVNGRTSGDVLTFIGV